MTCVKTVTRIQFEPVRDKCTGGWLFIWRSKDYTGQVENKNDMVALQMILSL
jgi:hypothetical protein